METSANHNHTNWVCLTRKGNDSVNKTVPEEFPTFIENCEKQNRSCPLPMCATTCRVLLQKESPILLFLTTSKYPWTNKIQSSYFYLAERVLFKCALSVVAND